MLFINIQKLISKEEANKKNSLIHLGLSILDIFIIVFFVFVHGYKNMKYRERSR